MEVGAKEPVLLCTNAPLVKIRRLEVAKLSLTSLYKKKKNYIILWLT